MFTHTLTHTVYLLLLPENILRFLYSPLCITFMYIIRRRRRRWEYFHLSILRATNCATNDTINTKLWQTTRTSTAFPTLTLIQREREGEREWERERLSPDGSCTFFPFPVTFLRPFHRVALCHTKQARKNSQCVPFWWPSKCCHYDNNNNNTSSNNNKPTTTRQRVVYSLSLQAVKVGCVN